MKNKQYHTILYSITNSLEDYQSQDGKITKTIIKEAIKEEGIIGQDAKDMQETLYNHFNP